MIKKININPEHRLTDLTGAAKVLNPLLRQILGNKGMAILELLGSWQNIVGKEISAYCLPQDITFNKDERTNGCLNLKVLSGAFAMEIQQKQRQIIEKVNTFFGYPAISKLKICQTGNPDDFLIGKKPFEKVKKKVVSANEESYITELIKDIKDENMRRCLKSIGESVFSRKDNQE